MLLKNDLLAYTLPSPHTVRILWIDASADLAYTYELEARSAMPERAALSSLLEALACGRAQRLARDPYAMDAAARAPAPKHLALRDRAWNIIAGLPLHEPALFQARRRGTLVMQHSLLHGVSYPTVYRYLRRYWQRGQHRDALLPDYCNSGAPGKTRTANANIKRGRPRKQGDNTGLNADPAIRLTFRAAVTRYAEKHAAFCRRAAYRQMIAEFFDDGANGAMPSFGQFNYWIEKDACLGALAAGQQNVPQHVVP